MHNAPLAEERGRENEREKIGRELNKPTGHTRALRITIICGLMLAAAASIGSRECEREQ